MLRGFESETPRTYLASETSSGVRFPQSRASGRGYFSFSPPLPSFLTLPAVICALLRDFSKHGEKAIAKVFRITPRETKNRVRAHAATA
jgi:hypothetical protein